MKRAVIYYSLTDNTKEAADQIAQILSADIYRIVTRKPMPAGKGSQMMFGGMQATFGMCPKILGMPENIDTYDEIIIGTPIWAGKHAPAMNTLLKNQNLREKITGVFTFSGGGDNDKCISGLIRKIPQLKYTVALADRNNKMAEENAAKVQSFAEEILNGQR